MIIVFWSWPWFILIHHRIGSFLSTHTNCLNCLSHDLLQSVWCQSSTKGTSVFWSLSVPLVHFSSIHGVLLKWCLSMPTICRQSMLWRPTTCIVGLLWGDFSHKAVLTRRQMYMSKCQHCHSEKILPTACHLSLVLLTAWLSMLFSLLRRSWSVGLGGYLHNWV